MIKIELLKKQKQDQRLIASLTDHRSKLTSGEPCPLCGAEHHPWAEHSPQLASDIDDKINSASQELARVQKELQSYRYQLSTSEASVKLNQVRKVELEQELQKITLSISERIKNYKGVESTEPSEIAISMQTLELKISKLNKAVGAIEELVIIEELLLDFEALDKVITDYKN